jgi:hypothetical protein
MYVAVVFMAAVVLNIITAPFYLECLACLFGIRSRGGEPWESSS